MFQSKYYDSCKIQYVRMSEDKEETAKSLVVTIHILLPILLLTGSNNLQGSASICHNL